MQEYDAAIILLYLGSEGVWECCHHVMSGLCGNMRKHEVWGSNYLLMFRLAGIWQSCHLVCLGCIGLRESNHLFMCRLFRSMRELSSSGWGGWGQEGLRGQAYFLSSHAWTIIGRWTSGLFLLMSRHKRYVARERGILYNKAIVRNQLLQQLKAIVMHIWNMRVCHSPFLNYSWTIVVSVSSSKVYLEVPQKQV